MRARELVRLLQKRPFKPIRVSLTDGQSYEIAHPELAIVDRFTLHLGIPGPKGLDEPVERMVDIDLLHIVRTELANARSTKRKGGDGAPRE